MMKLKLKFKNTLNNKKEIINNIKKTQTIIGYTCGPTVYDYIHIGNARVFVFSDLVYRILRFLYKDRKIV